MSIDKVESMSAAVELTERRSLEARLLQAQKMESVGLMAGSIAHDVNNILHVIVGFGSLSVSKMKEDDPLRDNLNKMIAAAGRASNLTKSLLNFSRMQPIVPRQMDLHETLGNVRSFLDMLVGEDIRLDMTCTAEALEVTADSGQLEQVVINLATNARHAMPEGGALSIATETVVMDQGFIDLHGFGTPGSYARVSVTDDGTGMDPETASRIFEPFYTTKPPREGTGLGLSIVDRIIREHNGFIDVDSEPDQGTTFRIYLPLTCAGERREGTSSPVDADGATAMPQPVKHEGGPFGHRVIVMRPDVYQIDAQLMRASNGN